MYNETERGTRRESGLKEKITGKGDKKKGQIKDGIGDVTEERELKTEGTWEKTKGTINDKVGKVKQKISDELDNKE
ncbi:CsbD family protein [Bacillus thuringiensis]|uniref:CsbD family protein n=1 Tax=Bacillus thuringiensis TaxID=1428 RepID=UPI002DBEC686|nr:CsbD family protein [Bacillus thuringiensis]MEC3034855.1 CsbD family protein [Bacillus thuringiensis]